MLLFCTDRRSAKYLVFESEFPGLISLNPNSNRIEVLMVHHSLYTVALALDLTPSFYTDDFNHYVWYEVRRKHQSSLVVRYSFHESSYGGTYLDNVVKVILTPYMLGRFMRIRNDPTYADFVVHHIHFILLHELSEWGVDVPDDKKLKEERKNHANWDEFILKRIMQDPDEEEF